MIIRMIIILLRFDGGSTEEEHDIAHIASSISCPHSVAGFFFVLFRAVAALAALVHPGHILMYAPRDVLACRLASADLVGAPFMATWLILVAGLNPVLLHHGAQLMVGHTQQLGGAALVVFGLLQTRFYQLALLLILPLT